MLQALHLRDQRRHVFQPRLGDLIAQRQQLLVVVDAPDAPDLARRQVLEHAVEHARFFGDDALHLLVALCVRFSGALGHAVTWFRMQVRSERSLTAYHDP